MGRAVVVVCEIFVFLFQGYCLQYFFGSFLEKRFYGRRKCSLPVILIYGGMKICFAYLLPAGREGTGSFYRQLLQCMFLPVIVFCFYKAAKLITVFLLTTFLALSEICFFTGYMVLGLSAPVLELETVFFMKGYIGAAFFEPLLRCTAAFLQIFCYLLWCLLLYYSLKKVVSSFREKDYEMHRTELLFILTPGLVGFLLCLLLRMIMITVEDGMPALLYDRYPMLRILIPAIMLLSLLSVLCSVKLFQDMISLGREQNSRIVLEQQIEDLQEHMGEIERLHEGMRGLKHDMKNTLSILLRLSAQGEDPGEHEFTAYAEEINRRFTQLERRFQTGNTVADALLNMKYHEVIRSIPEITFQADNLLFFDKLKIHGYDIGVILGNALDNAIEACLRLKRESPQAQPFIRLSSFQRGKYFFLEVENSFDGKLKKNGAAEFPSTLKTEKQMHGIGFANMKKTAEKYEGAVDFSVRGNPEDGAGYAVFTLSVMMKGGGENYPVFTG